MLISMTPNDEVKTIHASLNDGKLRKWEFEPYTENGKIELSDQDYATIQSIKGNTVKFNQLVDTSTSSITLTSGHKFITKVGGTYSLVNGTGQSLSVTGGTDEVFDLTLIFDSGNEPSTVSDFETWLSNNIGLLPYYDYTPGTLIPFKGTGLKTTGKNLLNIDNIQQGGIDGGGANTSSLTRVRMNNYLFVKKGMLSFLTPQNLMWEISFYNQANIPRESASGWQNKDVPITIEKDCYIRIIFRYPDNSNIIPSAIIDSQIEYGSVSTSYEPYTESTLSLEALNTLFPTGMKNIPNTDVYDEATSSKATTRIGSITLDGTQNYVEAFLVSSQCRVLYSVPDIMPRTMETSVVDDGIISNYLMPSSNEQTWNGNAGIHRRASGATQIMVSLGTSSGITSIEAWNAYLSSHPLTVYYPLATPTEQDISLDLTYPVYQDGTEQILPVNGSTPTTSPMVATIKYPDRTEDVDFLYKQTTFESAIPQFSLVCKNQELPMILNDGKLICECDSSITNESGFFDCKVKMQDLDSVAYSQKIQLHVERGIND